MPAMARLDPPSLALAAGISQPPAAETRNPAKIAGGGEHAEEPVVPVCGPWRRNVQGDREGRVTVRARYVGVAGGVEGDGGGGGNAFGGVLGEQLGAVGAEADGECLAGDFAAGLDGSGSTAEIAGVGPAGDPHFSRLSNSDAGAFGLLVGAAEIRGHGHGVKIRGDFGDIAGVAPR